MITYTDRTTQNLGKIPSATTTSVLEYILLPDGTYGVCAGEGAKTTAVIEIPAEYNGIAVTQILGTGFKDMTMLQQITIPATVTKIGASAFEGCISLDNVILPESVTLIDDKAFQGCTALANVTLSEALQTIGYRAFADCRSLEQITIPASVTTIKSYAFYLAGLQSVTFVDSEGWRLSDAKIVLGGGGAASGSQPFSNLSYRDGHGYDHVCKFDFGNTSRMAELLKNVYAMSYYTSGEGSTYFQSCFYSTDWIKE